MSVQRDWMALEGFSWYAFIIELQENIDKKFYIVSVYVLSFSLHFITCIGCFIMKSEAK